MLIVSYTQGVIDYAELRNWSIFKVKIPPKINILSKDRGLFKVFLIKIHLIGKPVYVYAVKL